MKTTPASLNVGPRVKHARSLVGMSQETLKSHLGFKDRQTVSDIETGRRAVRSEELLVLSEVLDCDVDYFLDPFNVVAETRFSWRASPDLPGRELGRLEAEASGWIGVLRWLREQQPQGQNPLTFSLRLPHHATVEQAQAKAEAMGSHLSLGAVPSARLADRIEHMLDIPVLFVEPGEHLVPGSVSGAACDSGGLSVILASRREGSAQRAWGLAHGLFHVLTWAAQRPGQRESNSLDGRWGTPLAGSFAAALLMPRATLDGLLDIERVADPEHLVAVADQLGVPVGALGGRLLGRGLIGQATQTKLAEGSSFSDGGPLPMPFSLSFVAMLHAALDQGQLSARKAAKALGMPLAELAALFPAYGLPSPFEL